ncbi:AI-2E family transporter [Haloprofundus halophilus]|uniref:AI-2E family transporter n=1 Tax=Haloprofundus halophilus TaxID=2283527 RepID=UPI000E451809|nr:AI-2E family transporter [Haloprofundus halophilus]
MSSREVSGASVRLVFAGVLVTALGIVAALILLPFLTYLLAAALLAFVLYPLQQRLAARVGTRLSAAALVALSVLCVVLPLGLLVYRLASGGSVVPGELEELPRLPVIESLIERSVGVEMSIRSQLNTALGQVSSMLAEQSSGIVGAGVHATFGVLLFVFVLYYLLKDGHRLVAWLLYVTPLPEAVQDELVAQTNAMTWAVLEGHVLVAVVQGIVAGAGLFVAGIPNAGFWTLVMMVVALIPVLGVGVVVGPAVLYLVVVDRLLAAVLLAAYGVTIVALIDDYLRAYLINRGSALNSAVILVGVLGGVYLLGPMGLFYGPILLGLFKATIEVFDDYYEVLERP